MKNYWVDLRAKKERANNHANYIVRIGMMAPNGGKIDTTYHFFTYAFANVVRVRCSCSMSFEAVSVIDRRINKEVYFEIVGQYNLKVGDKLDLHMPDLP